MKVSKLYLVAHHIMLILYFPQQYWICHELLINFRYLLLATTVFEKKKKNWKKGGTTLIYGFARGNVCT